jgi:hypothetical protein
MGKASERWQRYLRISAGLEDGHIPRGSVLHAPAGAIFAYRRWFGRDADNAVRTTAEVIMLTVYGHHSGLMDVITPDGQLRLLERMEQDLDALQYDEAERNFTEEVLYADDADALFEIAVGEIRTFLAKLKESRIKDTAFMLMRGIRTFIPARNRGNNEEGKFSAKDFIYDRESGTPTCPGGHQMTSMGYNRRYGARRFVSSAEICADCPLREHCFNGKNPYKEVDLQMDYWAMEEQHAMNNGTPAYWAAMRKRKILCEGNFAHQKAGHNLTRTRKRGLGNAFEHCLLSATALNVRRMVRILADPERRPVIGMAAVV